MTQQPISDNTIANYSDRTQTVLGTVAADADDPGEPGQAVDLAYLYEELLVELIGVEHHLEHAFFWGRDLPGREMCTSRPNPSVDRLHGFGLC